MKRFMNRVIVVVGLVLIFFPVLAHAKIPRPSEVPNGIPEPERSALKQRRIELFKWRDALKAKVVAHNKKCRSVKADSPLEAECRQGQKNIQSEVHSYAADVRNFNNQIRKARRRQAELKLRGRPGIDGIDVPPPAVKREETLQDWVHRNWSRAPGHLKWKIQRSLRDPKALKVLIMRNQIAISRWYGEATAESAWMKLVKGLPVWRVKALAWLDDPMHREWLGDAVAIGLLPLDAAAVSKGVLGGGRTVAAAAKTFDRKPSWVKPLNRALRSMGKAKSPSGTHYDFPSHYIGPNAPKMPDGLFSANPYVQLEGMEGTRLWYWHDAPDVWIKRTPEGDKVLEWVLTGKGRL